MTPFLGFAPDVDPATPGVITDCTQLVPTSRGMKSAPSAIAVTGVSALSAACRGAAVLQKTNGSRKTYAGTQTRIFDLSGTTWGTASGTFAGTSENRWSFAQFGDVAMAANDADAIQAATAATFAAVTGAPKARILVSVPNFVIALNTNDATGSATYGDSPDRWWCSGFQNPADWVPDTATQCTTGRLLGAGGEITAGAPFGSGLVVYKAREMFLGQYVGPDTVFDFQRIPGDQGCVGPEAVVDIGGAHVFLGEDNVWLYDGSRPVTIAENTVKQWLFDNLSAAYKYRTIMSYDRNNGRVWMFYPSTISTGNPDSALVYHLGSKKWGRANRTIEAAMSYVTPGVTWDTLSSVGSTWDTLPDVPWDSQTWQTGGRALAIFDTSHVLRTLTGRGEDSGLTTWDVGTDGTDTFVSRVRLRFFSEPTAATVTGAVRDGPGASGASFGSGSMANSKFDIRQTGRWHRFSFLMTGPMETGGFEANVTKAGAR